MWFTKRVTTVPAPFVVATTGEFDGCDGDWSTFSLDIGTDEPQEFRVLVSSLSGTTWLPKANGSCPSVDGKLDPSDCPSRRGIDSFRGGLSTGYQSGASSSYDPLGIFQLAFSGDLSMSNAFGSSSDYAKSAGQYGLEHVSLKSSISSNGSISADSTPFAAINDLEFLLGSLGLGIGSIKPGETSHPTFMELLASSGTIPSHSWGYTAGANYHNGYLGNLVLGGYDQSRFKPTDVTFSMPPSSDTTLLKVNVQSLQVDFDDGTSSSFTSDANQITNSFEAVLDSTLPYFYLPSDICNDIANKLNLRRAQDGLGNEIFLFNTTKSAAVPQKFDITVADINDPSQSTTITLPMSALNLTSRWPLSNDTRPYFPLRTSQGTNILGRAFFQEAYVIADYERHNFTIAQAVFPNPQPGPQIFSIYNTSFVPPAPDSSSSSGHKGISGGAIGGIVIAVLAVLAGISAWIFFAKRRKRKAERKRKEAEEAEEKEREEAARQEWRETMSTLSTAGRSYEMDASSRMERPHPTRQMSELSSDSEVDRTRKLMRSPSAIYELPDSDAWRWNQQRMNQTSPDLQAAEFQLQRGRSPGPSRNFSPDYFPPPSHPMLSGDDMSRGPSPYLQPTEVRSPGRQSLPSPPLRPGLDTPRSPSPVISPQDGEVDTVNLTDPRPSDERTAVGSVRAEPGSEPASPRASVAAP